MSDREAFEAYWSSLADDPSASEAMVLACKFAAEHAWRAALAFERAKRVEPSDDLVAKLRSLASELDADDSPEQIHPGAAICSQAADLIEGFQLQRDLDGCAWARHVERMRLAEAEVQRLNAALAQRTEPQQQADEFIAKQRPLPPEMAKVLADNIESLYEGEQQQQVEPVASMKRDLEKFRDVDNTECGRDWFISRVAWHLDRAAPPAVNPAPGYCPHCKQYTIEEPLPADDEAVRLLRKSRGLHADFWYDDHLDIGELDAHCVAIDAYLAKAKC